MNIEGFPLFRLNSLQILFWAAGNVLHGQNLRRELASMISKTYRSGCVVLSPTLYAIAVVRPNGEAIDLPPPFKEFEMWQVANKPSVRYDQCACRNYWDPEVQGPWRLRDKERGLDIHHPFCQFDRTAAPVWTQSYVTGTQRAKAHLDPQARPDEWVKTREAVLQS
jgi:hypothetical protein